MPFLAFRRPLPCRQCASDNNHVTKVSESCVRAQPIFGAFCVAPAPPRALLNTPHLRRGRSPHLQRMHACTSRSFSFLRIAVHHTAAILAYSRTQSSALTTATPSVTFAADNGSSLRGGLGRKQPPFFVARHSVTSQEAPLRSQDLPRRESGLRCFLEAPDHVAAFGIMRARINARGVLAREREQLRECIGNV